MPDCLIAYITMLFLNMSERLRITRKMKAAHPDEALWGEWSQTKRQLKAI